MRIDWTSKLIKSAQKILGKYTKEEYNRALAEISQCAGQKVTSHALRAAFIARNLGSPYNIMKAPAYVPDPVEEQVARDDESQDKRTIKQLIEQVRQAQARQSFLDVVQSYKAPPVILPREKQSGIRELTAVVLASDWHIEEPVDPEAVAYRNEYNLEIANSRVERFFQGIIWNIEHQRASKKLSIRDLVLWLGGDLMTGYIHPELIESNLLSPTETVRWLLPRLYNGITTVLERLKLEKMVVPCSFGNHGRCHDDQTELLTADGWKKYDQISVGDQVATYNMESKRTEWQPLQDVYVKDYEGPMVAVNTTTADFMVTPHHRMVVRSHNGPDEIVEMRQFVENGTMGSYNWPKCAEGQNEEFHGVSDDELLLLGWIMTDGTHATTSPGVRAIRIYQSKEHGITQLKELLDRLSIEYGTYTRTREAPSILGKQVNTVRPDVTFSVTVKDSQRLLELMPNKRSIPSWMQGLSTRQFNIFLEGLLAGDGNCRTRDGKSEERVIYGDLDVISSIQTLAITNGIAARVRTDNRGNGILSLPSSTRGYINNFEDSVKTVQYSGVIWCGTVQNGTLITRRNGIPLVSGNTTEKTRISTGYANSYEWLMYHSLADRFDGDKRVQFEVTNSRHQYVNVYDKVLHFHHGDEVRYMGGVGGIGIPLLKAVPQWDLIKRADYHNIGHFHQLTDFGRVVVNGSLIGYGPYSQSIRASFEIPQQALYYIDSKRGKCMTTAIWVDDDENYAPGTHVKDAG